MKASELAVYKVQQALEFNVHKTQDDKVFQMVTASQV